MQVPDEFEHYGALDEFFRKNGAANISHRVGRDLESATIRVINDDNQSVSDYYFVREGDKFVKKDPLKRNRVNTYNVSNMQPVEVAIVEEKPFPESKIESMDVEIDAPKPDKPIPKNLKPTKKSKAL